MPLEIINWLQDVREHRRVSQRREVLRGAGAGFDYASEAYQDVVQRTVSRLHPRRMRLRVTDVVRETPSTKTFRLERVDGPLPPFRAGQYVNVFVDVDGILTSRPYSIASAPPLHPHKRERNEGEEALELTVRDKPEGFVAPYLLNELQVGDELETSGPEGSFYYEPLIDGGDLVFLAGGSGITPFRAIIRDALQRQLPLQMYLLYGSRRFDDVIYAGELAELAAKHDNLSCDIVISEPPDGYDGLTGFLDAQLMRDRIGDVSGKTFYVCGPGVMYGFCLAALAALGVPAHKIRRELYGPPDDVTKEPGWPEGLGADEIFQVEVVSYSKLPTLPSFGGEETRTKGVGEAGATRTIRALAGEPLMNSLERYGIVVPAICRTGACSACRTRLISGRVFMPEHTGLREADGEHGYVHACVAYPLEHLRIEI
jgi:ferredoxin-NADP reductase/ferredoxin